ncbi:MAG: porin family protein [Hyphomicrobium sp.]|nr:porin family protein [Hyphomicrobium sp.]
MLKYWHTFFAAVVLAGALSGAAMADGYEYEPVGKSFAPPPEVWSWTGFYIGGHVGHSWVPVDGEWVFGSPDNNHLSALDIDGTLGGVHLGYNYQIQQFVVGIEGDWSWLNNSDSVSSSVGPNCPAPPCSTDNLRAEIDYLASIRARLGWAWQNVMLFGTVGWSWTEYEFSNRQVRNFDPPPPVRFGKISLKENGVVYGGGVEVGLSKSVLVRGEYLHYDVGTRSALPPLVGAVAGDFVRFDDIDVFRGAISFKLY